MTCTKFAFEILGGQFDIRPLR